MRPLPGVHLQPVHLARSVKVRLRLQPKLVHLQPVHLANPNPNPNPNPNQDAGHLWLQPKLVQPVQLAPSDAGHLWLQPKLVHLQPVHLAPTIGRGAPTVTA